MLGPTSMYHFMSSPAASAAATYAKNPSPVSRFTHAPTSTIPASPNNPATSRTHRMSRPQRRIVQPKISDASGV